MLLLGAVGWLFKATDFPRAPFLIGFVLAIPMERYYYLTESLYDGFEWMARPGVIIFAAILIGPAVWAGFKALRSLLHQNADDGHLVEEDLRRGDDEEEGDGYLSNTAWSMGASIGMALIFIAALVASQSFSPGAQLMPRLVTIGGLLVCLVRIAQELRARRAAGRPPVWTPDVRTALQTFVGMAVFLVLVMLTGYLAAVLLFIPAVLLYVARARPKVVVIYSAVFALVVLALPSLLPVDLPTSIFG